MNPIWIKIISNKQHLEHLWATFFMKKVFDRILNIIAKINLIMHSSSTHFWFLLSAEFKKQNFEIIATQPPWQNQHNKKISFATKTFTINFKEQNYPLQISPQSPKGELNIRANITIIATSLFLLNVLVLKWKKRIIIKMKL